MTRYIRILNRNVKIGAFSESSVLCVGVSLVSWAPWDGGSQAGLLSTRASSERSPERIALLMCERGIQARLSLSRWGHGQAAVGRRIRGFNSGPVPASACRLAVGQLGAVGDRPGC